ncbi:MAG: NrfD/PsrC family molybdoenzyme membrane anchor subunit [Nitrospirota bacterium]
MVHGEAWTLKELFVYPNEYIYWSIQIVMYPFMTGLVAGAFVLSSLYHVFGIRQLKDMARFSLVFSFALLFVAPMPLMFHLQQPLRGLYVFMTPHFTSAIAAFGIVFSTYGAIVASELWFVYRKHFAETALPLKQKSGKSLIEWIKYLVFCALTLGVYDISEESLKRDEKAVKILAAAGIPVACFLHGYAGFIFGSVKANALWMTPLMPVIFIMSAIVSGIALCMLTYIAAVKLRRLFGSLKNVPQENEGQEVTMIRMTSRYLLLFLIFAITLELLDLIFRGYTAVKSWDVLRSVIYGKDFVNIFILQYTLGNLVPLILFLMPRLTMRRAAIGILLVLFGVFMMRWNVVIGGQAFSLTFAGYMHYHLPLVPHDYETFKEGLGGALLIGLMPFLLFFILTRIFPVFGEEEG